MKLFHCSQVPLSRSTESDITSAFKKVVAGKKTDNMDSLYKKKKKKKNNKKRSAKGGEMEMSEKRRNESAPRCATKRTIFRINRQTNILKTVLQSTHSSSKHGVQKSVSCKRRESSNTSLDRRNGTESRRKWLRWRIQRQAKFEQSPAYGFRRHTKPDATPNGKRRTKSKRNCHKKWETTVSAF